MIPTAVLRFFQLIFAAIVLGLSVDLAKGQEKGSVPPTTGFSSFVGALGMILAAIGAAALFIEFLGGIVLLVVDGLAALLFFAAGIAWAVGLKRIDCDDKNATLYNSKLNKGCFDTSGDPNVWTCSDEDGDEIPNSVYDDLNSRCTRAYADLAFCFIAFIFALVIGGLAFWKSRKGGVHRSGVVV